ncbi:D-2-hydroxyacid dehydrogenase [Aurantiacibacter xanthus]|uniref:D-2-hydroxyacid dehydrogenase n=1 Tax=Aurantiacibacter xanthus TaxID=1784712 RepID=A0A3A1PCJ3_9SPHN|nr:D-2-hydroxyacid dehydrogenase [Aurantiacibacter xanthus]RIV91486.1 D-2-hydroxyacid dehydrogenase [Aurantiacibacter xanthus]
MTIAVLPEVYRKLIAPHLPDWIEPRFWENGEELIALASEAEIGWFDMFDKTDALVALERAEKLKWLNSQFAGVDWMPLDALAARGVRLTNGSGLNANAVAEFAVMTMLAEARGYADLIRAHDRKEWAAWPSAMRELKGSRALIMGYGEIGSTIGRILEGLQVEVTPMRRSARDGALGPDEWRDRLGDFDWVVLAMPGTPETAGMIGAAELAAMKREAVLVNYARADIIDQRALAEALHGGRLGGAILDLTDPEPLPSDHFLWDCPNIRITMHKAGLPTPQIREATAQRFLANCRAWKDGAPLTAEVDLALGY